MCLFVVSLPPKKMTNRFRINMVLFSELSQTHSRKLLKSSEHEFTMDWKELVHPISPIKINFMRYFLGLKINDVVVQFTHVNI
jgi:hypothetical protein